MEILAGQDCHGDTGLACHFLSMYKILFISSSLFLGVEMFGKSLRRQIALLQLAKVELQTPMLMCA